MEKASLQRAVQLYGDMVYKIAMVILRNPDDADDALQETFMRYFKRASQFDSAEHEKAWLIRCATHVSKGILRSIFRHSSEPFNENIPLPSTGSSSEFLFSLPLKDRMILQLRYVENYTSDEIAEIMSITPAAVRKRLERARKRAQELYKKEY